MKKNPYWQYIYICTGNQRDVLQRSVCPTWSVLKRIRSWELLKQLNDTETDTGTVEATPPCRFSDLWYINHLTVWWGEARTGSGVEQSQKTKRKKCKNKEELEWNKRPEWSMREVKNRWAGDEGSEVVKGICRQNPSRQNPILALDEEGYSWRLGESDTFVLSGWLKSQNIFMNVAFQQLQRNSTYLCRLVMWEFMSYL